MWPASRRTRWRSLTRKRSRSVFRFKTDLCGPSVRGSHLQSMPGVLWQAAPWGQRRQAHPRRKILIKLAPPAECGRTGTVAAADRRGHRTLLPLSHHAQARPGRAGGVLPVCLPLAPGARPAAGVHRRYAVTALTACWVAAEQREGVVHFDPAWCVLHKDNTNTVHLAEASLPEPVIADLNGDGSKEVRAGRVTRERGCAVLPLTVAATLHQVVLVTADARLLVYAQSLQPDPRYAPAWLACSRRSQAPEC